MLGIINNAIINAGRTKSNVAAAVGGRCGTRGRSVFWKLDVCLGISGFQERKPTNIAPLS